jgi:hypothetical protein
MKKILKVESGPGLNKKKKLIKKKLIKKKGHTLLLEKMEMYAFGNNYEYQCGIKSVFSVNKPTQVIFSNLNSIIIQLSPGSIIDDFEIRKRKKKINI